MTGDAARFEEQFRGPTLDLSVWMPAYLPAWSSRHAARASYTLAANGLHLTIPPDHPRWCADLHPKPLRVSAVQSGNWSGPVGSRLGQQPFRDGLLVREEQPTLWGFTPRYGRVEVEMTALLDRSSMFSAWMVGLEDAPERSGEICLVEVFGDTLADGRAAVGTGIHPFRDPALVEEFSADPLTIDIARPHRYSVDWQPGRVDFFLDGDLMRSAARAPAYPVQLIMAVFDFPDRSPAYSGFVPELTVHRVVGGRGDK